jgi:hypothetical protein
MLILRGLRRTVRRTIRRTRRTASAAPLDAVGRGDVPVRPPPAPDLRVMRKDEPIGF